MENLVNNKNAELEKYMSKQFDKKELLFFFENTLEYHNKIKHPFQFACEFDKGNEDD